MRRRGAAAVMAMVFLVVFGAIAVAFYAMASTSAQVARNDRSTLQAMAAAESGMAFVQRLVADVVLEESEETGSDVWGVLTTRLNALNGSATLDCDGDGQNASISADSTSIVFPPITPHRKGTQQFDTQQFSARIELGSDQLTETRPPIRMVVVGRDIASGVERTLSVTLRPVDRYFQIFTYGVASKGRIDLADQKASVFGDPPSSGSILSTYAGDAAITLHGGTISGDVFVVADPSTAFYTDTTGGSIGGASIDPNVQGSLESALTHVQQVDPPEFPEFTPNIYDIAGLTNRSSARGESVGNINPNHYANIRITGDMEFGGNDVLEGIIFVKAGVNVTFAGNPTIRGTIVVEDSHDPRIISKITFKGVPVYQTPVYPGLDSAMSAALAGYSFLGPTAYVYLTGNVQGYDPLNPTKVKPNPENAEFARTIVCSTLEEYGSGIVKIRDGALITLSDTMMTGKQGYSGYFDGDGVRLVRTAGYAVPFGAYIHRYSYLMDASTYQEGQ